jgi:hypothetical protein
VANSMQIKCISRTERMSPHERITHIGGYESSQWKITLNDAIGKIERGEQAFSVQAHRKTVSVIVAVSPSSFAAPRMPIMVQQPRWGSIARASQKLNAIALGQFAFL